MSERARDDAPANRRPERARARARWPRIALLVAVYGALLLAGNSFSEWAAVVIETDLEPLTQSTIDLMVVGALVLYVVLLALPFVPGIEIGVGLIMLFGPKVSVVVYLATVAALSLSYLIGRLLPARLLALLFGALAMSRAEDLVRRLEPLGGRERLELLTAQAPRRIVPLLLRYRYLAIFVAVNLPGNSLVGGGGGIAMAAGLSRLFSAPLFIITIAVAVAPVPLAILVLG